MTKNEDGTIQIKSDEIIEYLQNKLGFQIYSDFVVWDGLIGRSYDFVLMRVVIPSEHIVEHGDISNLEDMRIKADKYDLIRPYMFDRSMLESFLHNPENRTTLLIHGIYGYRLNDLIRYSRLQYNKANDAFYVYLRPYEIIFDILSLSRQNDWIPIKKLSHRNSEGFTITVSVEHKRPNIDCSNVLL